MTPCYDLGGGLTVCTGSNRKFLARTHTAHARRYNVVSRHRSKRAAIMAMAKAVADDRLGRINRADVIMTADYYDPILVCELTR